MAALTRYRDYLAGEYEGRKQIGVRENPDGATCYAAAPGQATSYLLGSLEIQRLRMLADRELGDEFDIRVFHDRILENGAVTLPMLAMSIEAWIEETLAE